MIRAGVWFWSQAEATQALGVAASLVRSLPRVSLGEVHPFGGLAGQEEMLETLYQEAGPASIRWPSGDMACHLLLDRDDALLPEL